MFSSGLCCLPVGGVHVKMLKCCNLIGLQNSCSGTNPGIRMSPNPPFFARVGLRPTKATCGYAHQVNITFLGETSPNFDPGAGKKINTVMTMAHSNSWKSSNWSSSIPNLSSHDHWITFWGFTTSWPCLTSLLNHAEDWALYYKPNPLIEANIYIWQCVLSRSSYWICETQNQFGKTLITGDRLNFSFSTGKSLHPNGWCSRESCILYKTSSNTSVTGWQRARKQARDVIMKKPWGNMVYRDDSTNPLHML